MQQATDPAVKESPANPAAERRSRPWFRRYPIANFLIALVLTIVSSPFEEHYEGGNVVEGMLLTVVMISALAALGGRRRTLVVALVIISIALVGKWGNHWRPDRMPAEVYLVAMLLFFIFVEVHLLGYMLRARRVDSEVLCASIAAYLILGLLWTCAYVLIARLIPGSFVFSDGSLASHTMAGFNAIYFSYCTLCTLGCGDIMPVSSAARSLAMTQATFGTIYMAVLVARFVSLYSTAGIPGQSGSPERTSISDNELRS